MNFNFITIRLPVIARSQKCSKNKEVEKCVGIFHFAIELCNEFTNNHFIRDSWIHNLCRAEYFGGVYPDLSGEKDLA